MERIADEDGPLVRTSVLIPRSMDRALRDLAQHGNRPVTWEIRQAISEHLERCGAPVGAPS